MVVIVQCTAEVREVEVIEEVVASKVHEQKKGAEEQEKEAR